MCTIYKASVAMSLVSNRSDQNIPCSIDARRHVSDTKEQTLVGLEKEEGKDRRVIGRMVG